MVIRDDTRPHWRTMDMGRVLGINIAAALRGQRLPRQDYQDMVDVCATCTWAEGCRVWVTTQARPVRQAPEICGNRAAFAALKP